MTTLPTRLAVVVAATAVAGGAAALTAASASATTLPACGNAALTVTRSVAQGAAGHSFMELIYRNHTSQTCTVRGYPGLDAVAADGHVLAHAVRTPYGAGSTGAPRTITIRPGHYASAGVEWENFNPATGGPCRHSAAIVTTVANTTRPHRLAASVNVCGLEVTPTVAGTPLYPDYGPAQHAWIVGASAIAADQGYYWAQAAHHLSLSGDYPQQVSELHQLIALPDTGLTPAQIAQVHALVHDLNVFFATPHLYA